MLGSTFLLKTAISDHIWLVACQASNAIVLFNFTTVYPETIDQTCVITPREYPILSHNSVIAYQHGKVLEGKEIDLLFKSGVRRFLDPVPSAVLARIQRGAIESKFTPNKIKILIRSILP
jgi:hypothetical protein